MGGTQEARGSWTLLAHQRSGSGFVCKHFLLRISILFTSLLLPHNLNVTLSVSQISEEIKLCEAGECSYLRPQRRNILRNIIVSELTVPVLHECDVHVIVFIRMCLEITKKVVAYCCCTFNVFIIVCLTLILYYITLHSWMP